MACCPPAFGANASVLGRKAAARAEDLEPRQLAACAWALASCRERSPEWLEALRLGLGKAAGLRELAPLCWVGGRDIEPSRGLRASDSAWAASEADSGVLEEAALLRAKLLLNERDSPESLLQLAWAASFGAPGRRISCRAWKRCCDPKGVCLINRGRRILNFRMQSPERAKGRRPPLSSQVAPSPRQAQPFDQKEDRQAPMGFVVIHKPVHWEVDDGADSGSSSGRQRPLPLSRFMRSRFPERPILFDPKLGSGFLGRLDAQSSGLVMCALTYEAFLLLQLRQDSFAVAREYLVLCHGFLRQPQELCAPIWTAEESSRVDWAKGQAAKTRLKPVAHLAEGYSLLAISIVTGRKHQIRCHLAHLGHAVVCDGRYAPEALQADLSWCPRNFLHRFRLELPGIDGARFEAACGLPEDLQQVLRKSRPEDARSGAVLQSLAAGEANWV
ncbi:unnamed protein product [Effrenium voratum]|nr:unnamed protein product [Effrenium voratum]